MKILILIIMFLSVLVKSENYVIESSASLKSDNMIITDNLLVKSHNIEIRWTDSLGEYGKGRCLGTSKKEDEEVTFQVYCEYFDSTNDKFWTLLQRSNSDASAGVGEATYLNGTGKYKKFKGLKCNYAIKYMDDNTSFYRHKCLIKN